jgi:hypothetical protein
MLEFALYVNDRWAAVIRGRNRRLQLSDSRIWSTPSPLFFAVISPLLLECLSLDKDPLYHGVFFSDPFFQPVYGKSQFGSGQVL